MALVSGCALAGQFVTLGLGLLRVPLPEGAAPESQGVRAVRCRWRHRF